MTKSDDFDHQLEPHRDEQLAAANEHVAARLGERGIAVSARERSEDLADLMAAVERFEAMVEAHGGDTYVDDPNSPQPDDRHFVLPARISGEKLTDYIQRIDAARTHLKRHPSHPDPRD